MFDSPDMIGAFRQGQNQGMLAGVIFSAAAVIMHKTIKALFEERRRNGRHNHS